MKLKPALYQLIAAVMILVLGLVTAACSPGGDNSQAPQVGKQAPDFQLYQLDGQLVSLSNFQGRPVMVNFWASWCQPCVYEMPFIQEIFGDLPAQGPVILAINIGESPSQVMAFMKEHNLSFPVLLDSDGQVAEQYNIRGIPTTIFIDREGIIRAIKIGAFPSRAALEQMLGKINPESP